MKVKKGLSILFCILSTLCSISTSTINTSNTSVSSNNDINSLAKTKTSWYNWYSDLDDFDKGLTIYASCLGLMLSHCLVMEIISYKFPMVKRISND